MRAEAVGKEFSRDLHLQALENSLPTALALMSLVNCFATSLNRVQARRKLLGEHECDQIKASIVAKLTPDQGEAG